MSAENNQNNASLIDYLKAWPQFILPHYLLSNLMYLVTRSKVRWWKNTFIRWFISQYKINMAEAAQSDPTQYSCFNEFFTRPLREDARVISSGPKTIISPVDGAISQSGLVQSQRIFQAKGQDFTLEELLGGDQRWVDHFTNGEFVTIYLSPKDYHRIHMPQAGTLLHMTHIPGRLFSVSPATTRTVPRLFARNERVVTYFDTAHGPMALILVGALFVASMETVWHGTITPPHGHKIQQWNYTESQNSKEEQSLIKLNQAAEMGRFNMGSTVILLFPPNCLQWDKLRPGQSVNMGEKIGSII